MPTKLATDLGGRNGHGLHRPEPLAQDLVAAIVNAGKGGNGNGGRAAKAVVTKAHARRIAVEFGGAMLEATSIETASHSDDVMVVTRALSDRLEIKGAERQDVLAAARLHDVGKVAVPPEILVKPRSLNYEEWEVMRQHTVIGECILGSVPELAGIARMVRHCHERWDGAGYPDGLAGEEIPLGSRVIFCADAFHAIRSDRRYRAGRSAAESLAEIKRCAGTQFDPLVVAAFEQVVRDLRLAPAGSRARRSSRLTALLMMLVIGVTGSAIARTNVLGDPAAGGQAAAPPLEQPGQALLPLTLGDLFAGRSADDRARPVFDGELGSRAARPAQRGTPGGAATDGDSVAPDGDVPAGGVGASGGAEGAGGSSDASQGSSDQPGQSGGNPHGGPPGQTGEHPQGGPPGQTGNHPQGGPPGQTGTHPQGGPPGQTGTHPQGGPPGQSGTQSNGTPPGQSISGPPGQSKKN